VEKLVEREKQHAAGSAQSQTGSSYSRSRSRRHRKRFRSPRSTWAGLVGLLTFAPFAFGAVEYWAIAIVEVWALVLAAMWIIGSASRGEIRFRTNDLVWASMGFQAWIGLQLVLHKSLDPLTTRDDLLLLFCYFLVFLVVANEAWSTRWQRRLMFAVVTIAFLVALVGIAQYFTWNGKILWIRHIAGGSPFGPYVNHNHFAGLMEMTAPVAFGLAFSRTVESVWKVLFLLMGAVLVGACLLTVSRGGLISITFSLALFLYIFARKRGVRKNLLRLSLAGGVILLVLLGLGISPILERINQSRQLTGDASFTDRLLIYKDTLNIVHTYPFAGSGLGTFQLINPLYVTKYHQLVWTQTHNDYLQLLAETGLIGFAFAVWWLVAFVRRFILSVSNRERPISMIRLGAYCGGFGILAHSFVDFNLQIPANALYFIFLVAMLSRQSTHSGRTAPSEAGATGDQIQSQPHESPQAENPQTHIPETHNAI
jgi:O-antigen ligase